MYTSISILENFSCNKKVNYAKEKKNPEKIMLLFKFLAVTSIFVTKNYSYIVFCRKIRIKYLHFDSLLIPFLKKCQEVTFRIFFLGCILFFTTTFATFNVLTNIKSVII